MSVVICDGNLMPLHHFCQWDQDRIIKITGLELTEAPSFRFYNSKSVQSQVVPGTLVGGVVTTQVPNSLLEEGLSLVASIITSTRNGQNNAATLSNGSTYNINSYEESMVCSFRIPVIPNPRPSDYIESQNIEYVSWAALESEARDVIERLDALEQDYNNLEVKRINRDISITYDGLTWAPLFSIDDIRSSKWFAGTAITGTSTTGRSFNTGISDARVDDYYVNTDTTGTQHSGNVYRCIESGNSTSAKWSYAGNIKGVAGSISSVSARIGDGTIVDGAPSVTVTNTGTINSAILNFEFENIRGSSPQVSLRSDFDGYVTWTITDKDGSTTRRDKIIMSPKGDWNISSPYKFLDVVKCGSAAYVAKMDVPANTQIDNSSYWMDIISNTGIEEGDHIVLNCGTSTTNLFVPQTGE